MTKLEAHSRYRRSRSAVSEQNVTFETAVDIVRFVRTARLVADRVARAATDGRDAFEVSSLAYLLREANAVAAAPSDGPPLPTRTPRRVLL